MKKLVFTFVLIAASLSAFAQVKKITTTEAKFKLKQTEFAQSCAELKKQGFKEGNIEIAEVYTGKDSLGNFEVTLICQKFTNAKGANASFIGTEVVRNKLSPIRNSTIEKTIQGSQAARLSIPNCWKNFVSSGQSCLSCFNTIKSCVEQNNTRIGRITCILRNAIGPCGRCIRDIQALISCLRN